MFSRAELKMKAKEVLKTNYWMSLAVVVVVNAVSNILSLNIGVPMGNIFGDESENIFKYIGYNIGMGGVVFLYILIAFLLLALLINIFFISPLVAGQKKYFIESSKNKTNFMIVCDVFKNGTYLKVVKTLFLKNLILLGWSLVFFIPYFTLIIITGLFSDLEYFLTYLSFGTILLIIPYIMKFYSYYFVEYIVSENPEIEWRKALKMSKDMTSGIRYNIFVLELSFIGWSLLGAMLCFVGGIFVLPYIEATFAQLYLERIKVIENKNYKYENLV